MSRDRHRTRYLFDRILASDPSLDRFRSGLRALLTAGLCAGLFLLLTRWLDLEYELSLAGSVVAVVAIVSLQDPGRRQQQVTMAWMPVMASVALVIGTLAAGKLWLSGALFMATIFNSFEMRRFGPRGASLGTISYQSFFYAMLFKNPPDKVWWLPVFVVIGCAIAFAVHFWLVPEHPGRMFKNEVRACRARIAVLLHDLARWLRKDDKAGAKRIDAHLAALNGLSLGLDTRLAGFAKIDADGARLREQVLRTELAAEAVADVARAQAPDAALADMVRELEAVTGKSKPDIGPAAWSAQAPSMDADARWRLCHAAEVLATMAPWRGALPAMRDERQSPPAGQATQDTGKHAGWFDDITRRALQACGAALGALAAGYAISPSHWYWAVFAAFVVFTRSTTVGQTLSGAWRQVLASLAGVCLGVLFAELVHGNRGVELTLLFVFVAAGFYAFKGMQNVYTVLLTAMLAMLYELMGMNSPQMLLLRLTETATGALIAVLSARLILPVHTEDESDRKGADLLRAAGHLLASGFDDGKRPPLHEAMRELDRKLQALRAALGPVTGAEYPAAKDDHRARLHRLSRIAFCIRHVDALLRHAPELAHAREVQAAARALAPELDAAAAQLDAPGSAAVRPVQPGVSVAEFAPRDPALDDGGREDCRAVHIAVRWLEEARQLLRSGTA
jgi:uncharacterized membrane protein YccC